MELQGDECSHLYHCSQQGRAHATHGAVLQHLWDMFLDAEYGYGWRVGRTLKNPGAPEHLRTWRADLFGFDPSCVCVLVEVSVTCLTGDSAMRSRGEDMRGRVKALLRDTHDLTYTRNARASTSPRSIGFCVIWDCISSSSSSSSIFQNEKYAQPPDRGGDSGAQCFVRTLCLSSDVALGARANAFLKQVIGFDKKEGAAWHAHFSSTAGVYLVYYLVLHFLAAVDFHGFYGDERRLCRQGPWS